MWYMREGEESRITQHFWPEQLKDKVVITESQDIIIEALERI